LPLIRITPPTFPKLGLFIYIIPHQFCFFKIFYMYFTTKIALIFFQKNHIYNFYFRKIKEAKPFYTFYQSVYRLYLAEHKKAGCSAFA